MRARNVGEICAGQVDDLQGDIDEQKRWEEASQLEEATRDLPSRDPEGLQGRDFADFGLEIGGSAATQPKNIVELKGRTIGACHGLPKLLAPAFSRRPSPNLESHLCS